MIGVPREEIRKSLGRNPDQAQQSNESQCFWQTFNVSQAFELGVYQIHLARISRSETLHKVIHSVRRSTLVIMPSRLITLSQHEVRSVCQTFTLLVLCTG